MSKISQKQKVLTFLKTGNTITPLDAFRWFNSLRLSDIIFRLKKEGHNIKTKIIKTESHKHVAEYRLIPKDSLF